MLIMVILNSLLIISESVTSESGAGDFFMSSECVFLVLWYAL